MGLLQKAGALGVAGDLRDGLARVGDGDPAVAGGNAVGPAGGIAGLRQQLPERFRRVDAAPAGGQDLPQQERAVLPQYDGLGAGGANVDADGVICLHGAAAPFVGFKASKQNACRQTTRRQAQ